MKITVDTNVLLRALIADNTAQTRLALDTLESADVVAVSLQALCEFAWVLDRRYRLSRAEIAAAIVNVIETHRVSVDRPAVQTGLSMLIEGSDFADGVIAHDGVRLGGDVFASFDTRAVRALKKLGTPAHLLQ